MNELYNLDAGTVSKIKELLASSGGQALILIHPFNFGATAEERERMNRGAQTYTRLGGGTPHPAGETQAVQDKYLHRLEDLLRNDPSQVGFVFEGVDPTLEEQRMAAVLDALHDVELPESHEGKQRLVQEAFASVAAKDFPTGIGHLQIHVAQLRQFDPRGERIWIVIPTTWGNANPKRSWHDTLHAMVELGLRHVRLGGCYLLTCQGQPVKIQPHIYACINHAFEEMETSRLFKKVEVSLEATYVHDVEP